MKPIPRLRAILPGELFVLLNENKLKTRILLDTDNLYGYHADGHASLCHPISRVGLEWGEYGWRTKQE